MAGKCEHGLRTQECYVCISPKRGRDERSDNFAATQGVQKENHLMDLNNGLGASLKAIRKLRGVTQQQVAERVGLERTSICNIEKGKQMLSVRTLNDIAAALGYEVKVHFRPMRITSNVATPPNADISGERAEGSR